MMRLKSAKIVTREGTCRLGFERSSNYQQVTYHPKPSIRQPSKKEPQFISRQLFKPANEANFSTMNASTNRR